MVKNNPIPLKSLDQIRQNELEKALSDSPELMLFYLAWLKNGLNAGKAYKALHPNVGEHSARTLGSRQLTKVDKQLIMATYTLDLETYFSQLREGLQATKWNSFTNEREADHSTRKDYLDKLGRLLGLDDSRDKPPVSEMINVVFNVPRPPNE